MDHQIKKPDFLYIERRSIHKIANHKVPSKVKIHQNRHKKKTKELNGAEYIKDTMATKVAAGEIGSAGTQTS